MCFSTKLSYKAIRLFLPKPVKKALDLLVRLDPSIIKTSAIEKVKQRFETWRKVREKRTKLSEELWQAALELSSDYSK